MFFYIWHIFFNRKLTSDCPIRHLWNHPNNISSIIFEVHVILVKFFKIFSTHTVCAYSCNRGETNFQIRLYSDDLLSVRFSLHDTWCWFNPHFALYFPLNLSQSNVRDSTAFPECSFRPNFSELSVDIYILNCKL